MRRKDERGSPVDGDLIGVVADHVAAPPSLGTPDEQRRVLLAELRSLIEADDYQVDPRAVAEAIIDESLGFVHWID